MHRPFLTRPRVSTPLRAFLGFTAVSGCGWLFDIALMTSLVRFANVPAAPANMVSSLSASALVFLFARGRIFAAAGGSTPARLAAYIAYVGVQITLASMVIGALAPMIGGEARALGLAASATLAAALAKIIVTPAQLMANFLVAGWLNAAARPEPAHA